MFRVNWNFDCWLLACRALWPDVCSLSIWKADGAFVEAPNRLVAFESASSRRSSVTFSAFYSCTILIRRITTFWQQNTSVHRVHNVLLHIWIVIGHACEVSFRLLNYTLVVFAVSLVSFKSLHQIIMDRSFLSLFFVRFLDVHHFVFVCY